MADAWPLNSLLLALGPGDGLLLGAMNFFEIIFAVIVVFGFVFRIVGAIAKNNQQPRRPPAAPRPPVQPVVQRPRMPAGPGPGQGPAGQGARPVSKDVNEFLLQAAARRQAQGQGGPARPQPAPVPAARPQPAQRTAHRPPPGEAPITAEVVPARGEGLRTIKSNLEGQRLATLQSQVEQADENMESEVLRDMSHQVGTFAQQGGPQGSVTSHASQAGETTPSLAAELAARLADPAGMRDAIILNEILQRPEHRW